MKIFAITPDNITYEDLIEQLPSLKEKNVSFLYIRFAGLFDYIQNVIPAVRNSGLIPFIPFHQVSGDKDRFLGIHYKNNEISLFKQNRETSKQILSVSCHDFLTAEKLLELSADYVFLSPVFHPLSKPGDMRDLLSRAELKKLLGKYGERVVLLGGITKERIDQLHDEIQEDFSAAGITMFFRKQV